MDGENNGKPYEQMDDLGGFNPLSSECHPFGGHEVPTPKERSPNFTDASWPQHLYSSVPLAECQYHPAWWKAG